MNRSLKVIIAVIGAFILLSLALASIISLTPTEVAAAPPAAPPARPANPGSSVYTLYDNLWIPSEDPPAHYEWVEINNSADYAWDLGDPDEENNVSPNFPIGFIFPFYNDFYTQFRVSEKGFIFFEHPNVDVGPGTALPDIIADQTPGGIPNDTDNFIAPFAGDLFGYPGISRVYIRNDTSPRRAIIEFENVVWCCGPYNPRTFQIILYPSGDIDVQYRKITNFSGNLDDGQTVRLGLENLEGTEGDVYNQGLFNDIDAAVPAYLQDSLDVYYNAEFTAPHVIFWPDSERIWDDPGHPINVSANLYLAAPETVTRSFNIMTSSLVVSSILPASTWADNITHTTFVPVFSGTYSATVQFVLTVPVGANFWDVATATFVAESVESPPTTDTFTVVYGPAHRDLQIQKDLNPNIWPASGGAFRYRLIITNTDYNNSDRAAIARSVVVTDLLQTGVAYEDCRRQPYYQSCGGAAATSTVAGGTVFTLTVGDMNIDETRTIYLELRDNGAFRPINNTAHITLTDGIELGDGPNNHDSSAPINAADPQQDLHIEKHYWYNNDYVAAGQSIPFDIDLYNDGSTGHSGNVPVDNVVVVDVLPEDTTFDRAELYYEGPALSPEGSIAPTISGPMSRTLTFTVPKVDNGYWNELHLIVWISIPPTIPVGTYLTNTATVQNGPSATETVIIGSNYIDPFVDKGPTPDYDGNIVQPEPGKSYTYWITYGNRSVLTQATNFIISDTLPASVTLVSASPGDYLTGPFISAVSGQTVISWYTSTLPAGAMGEVMIMVDLDSDVPPGTELANTIVATYTGTFTPSTTDDDTDVFTIEVASDFNGSQKLVNNPTPSAGSEVEYTILISNTGAATTYTVIDTLPPELTYVSSSDPQPATTPPPGTAGGNITWAGSINENSQVELKFRARITETAVTGDVISNTANIATAGGVKINRRVDVTVAGGVFANSSKTVTPNPVARGGQVEYTLTISNSGSAAGAITVTDSLPPSVTLPSAFNPSAGSVTPPGGGSRVFTWTATVGANRSETLRFEVTVSTAVTNGDRIENVAWLETGGVSVSIPLRSTLLIQEVSGGIYLPIIVKQ
ncbi:MAG: DUF11 domain-containing protein [Anaerolineae bacterium]|nr:DUF11 domain-containing protein [Anaerolineae bacterium]